jgi:hypothetical protein
VRDARFSSKAYGTHDYKEITIEGRVQFDLLQAIQRDHKLSSYSLNSGAPPASCGCTAQHCGAQLHSQLAAPGWPYDWCLQCCRGVAWWYGRGSAPGPFRPCHEIKPAHMLRCCPLYV